MRSIGKLNYRDVYKPGLEWIIGPKMIRMLAYLHKFQQSKRIIYPASLAKHCPKGNIGSDFYIKKKLEVQGLIKLIPRGTTPEDFKRGVAKGTIYISEIKLTPQGLYLAKMCYDFYGKLLKVSAFRKKSMMKKKVTVDKPVAQVESSNGKERQAEG